MKNQKDKAGSQCVQKHTFWVLLCVRFLYIPLYKYSHFITMRKTQTLPLRNLEFNRLNCSQRHSLLSRFRNLGGSCNCHKYWEVLLECSVQDYTTVKNCPTPNSHRVQLRNPGLSKIIVIIINICSVSSANTGPYSLSCSCNVKNKISKSEL